MDPIDRLDHLTFATNITSFKHGHLEKKKTFEKYNCLTYLSCLTVVIVVIFMLGINIPLCSICLSVFLHQTNFSLTVDMFVHRINRYHMSDGFIHRTPIAGIGHQSIMVVVVVVADEPSMENQLMEMEEQSRNASFAQITILFGSVQNSEISQQKKSGK